MGIALVIELKHLDESATEYLTYTRVTVSVLSRDGVY
jgi:hypothetical protein